MSRAMGISLRLADDACGDPLHLGRAAYVRGDTARGAFPQLGWRSIQALIATIDRFRNDTVRNRSLLPMVAPQPASRLSRTRRNPNRRRPAKVPKTTYPLVTTLLATKVP